MERQSTESKKHLILVAGPTAVGKTDLSVRLAKQLGAEILSADSRQFYRELNTGTAKPTAEEQQGVPHHFIDSLSITAEYSAGKYEEEALDTLQRLFYTQDRAVVVGGSGLYVKAICEGMDEMPEAAPHLREELVALEQKKGLPHLLSLLEQHDPEYFRQVDRSNPQRVIRALEVSLASGQPYSSYRRREARSRPFQIHKIGLNRDRSELYDRIDRRVDHMLENGLLEEVQRLFPYRAHQALQTVGYQEIFGYLEGKYDWEEAVRLLKRNSRRYAKRQLTWFRRDQEFTWFHPDEFEKILVFLQEKLQ